MLGAFPPRVSRLDGVPRPQPFPRGLPGVPRPPRFPRGLPGVPRPEVFPRRPVTNNSTPQQRPRQHYYRRIEQQTQRKYTVVPCVALTTGYMVSPTTMAAKWDTFQNVKIVINYNFRKITIYFSTWMILDELHMLEEPTVYKAEFDFRDLEVHSLHPEKDGKEGYAYFTLIAKHPPQYWKEHPAPLFSNQQSKWTRSTEIPMYDGTTTTSTPSISPLQRQQQESVTQYLPLGEWTAFRLQVSLTSGSDKNRFNEVLELATASRLVPHPNTRYRCDKKLFVVDAYEYMIPLPGNTTMRRHGLLSSATIPSAIFENFDMYYTLESYFSHRILIPATVDETFYSLYADMTPIQAYSALRYMMAMVDTGLDDDDDSSSSVTGGATSSIESRHIWNPTEALRELMQKPLFADMVKETTPRNKRKHKDNVKIRKVLVTPTTLVFELPQSEPANRVLRHFKKDADRFIRVQFIEEGQHRLQTSSRPHHSSAEVYQRISHALKYGIQIGKRHYEFLAYSSSQLREHGCWFFASDDTLNVDMIRKWMGVFSNEHVVAKYAARMGQCFSSTYPTVQLQKNQVLEEHLKDIIQVVHSEENPEEKPKTYTFSDGVGCISSSLAMMVATKMRLSGTAYPSAFQFRLGGAKGVLSVSPTIPGGKLALRPSQKKFESPHRMLEINRVSTRSIAFLNRQIIVILSTLGVADEAFLDLLHEMLEELDCITSDPDRCIAMLRANSDEDGVSREMAALVQHGFLASGDPYIAHLLHVYRLCKLKEAKKRAKIPVVKGAHVLGVMDETNTLKEDEVFCQLSDSSHTEASRHIVTGECLVFRSPSLHPGDARVLKAVDCPELKHLHNVIVFSSKGQRDVPSMLSGGDLDGDTYSIIWDERLYPSKEKRNREPMDVTPLKPKEVDNVQISDIHDFFVEYIENDNLGLIANAHLVRADQSDDGVSDPMCMKLAQLHSHAVDFPKTGVMETLPDEMRAGRYPDFMEKKDKPSYESQKILGQLYRSIKSGEFQHYRAQLRTKKTEYDKRLRYPGMEKYIARARRMKRYYDEELTSLMDQFGIPTEAEFMTGCIIRTYRQDEHKSYYELRSMARREMMRLKEHWRCSEFVTLRKRSKKSPTREEVEQDCAKAAAFYYVTYHWDEQEKAQLYYGAYRKNRNLLLSFAWLAQDLLFRILKEYQFGILAPCQDPIAPVEEDYESFEEYLESDFSDEEPVSDDGCY